MKRFLFALMITGLIYSCNNSSKNQSVDNNQTREISTNNETDKGESAYYEIKQHFDKGYYVDLNRMISQFFEYKSQSSYFDSVKVIQEKLVLNKNQIKQIRDSLSRLSPVEYFNGLDLPGLDSVTHENYDIIKHHYTLDFNDFDKKIFKTDWDENWYLSSHLSGNNMCIAVCHFRDCENSIVLYSVDSNYLIIDSKEIYDNGCYAEPAQDFRYKQYLVNEHNRLNVTYFHGDSAFTRISRTYFSLRDTITDKVKVEIGDEQNVSYKMNSSGKFIMIENRSFEKEYVKPLYKVPI